MKFRNIFVVISIVFILFGYVQDGTASGKPIDKGQTEEVEVILLDCATCEQTEEAARAYLEANITNISTHPRLVYVQTYLRDGADNMTGESLFFVYLIKASQPSSKAIFKDTTYSFPCPRGCDAD